MSEFTAGKVLLGDAGDVLRRVDACRRIPVDQMWPAPEGWEPPTCRATIANPFTVSGRGTYQRKIDSTLHFEPFEQEGWWIDRTDQPLQLPVRASIRNVWTTLRSIVLRSGGPHNYMRMVEHVVALRLGLGIDDVLLRMSSGDPPLFDIGSEPIVHGVDNAGIREIADSPLTYWTVREPVTVLGRNDSFLHILPADPDDRVLHLDCAIDFPTAIGKQRIQFDLCPNAFRHGAKARTNCTLAMVWFCRTIGKFFADTRNLGYTRENIVVAGRRRYHNTPRLIHEGKSLEAVWHRSCLDLIAALSLIDTGRIAGRILSYKAGHDLDVKLVTQLYLHDMLVPM